MPIDDAKLATLRERLRLLEDSSQTGAEAETHYFGVLGELLEHDGYTVTAMRAQPDRGLDLTAVRTDGARAVSVGVEFKHYSQQRPIPPDVLDRALDIATRGKLDRLLLVANRPYSNALRQLAGRATPVAISLLGLHEIRSWIDRVSQTLTDTTRGLIELTREYLVRAVRAIAAKPQELRDIEWRNLELLLGELFSGLGFDVQVTPASNDGGKDVILTATVSGHQRTYYVELKHWLTSKPGPGPIKEFLHVSAIERTDGGLFLASTGFTAPTFEVIAEVGRPVALGDSRKMVSLCRTYVRAESGLWSPPSDPFEVLSTDAALLRSATG